MSRSDFSDIFSDPFGDDRITRRIIRDRFSSSFAPFESSSEGSEKTPGKYTVNVPLGSQIHPNDIKITIKNHTLIVEAKKEKKSEDGSSSTRLYQEVTRKITLPENIDINEIKSVFDNGVLKIEAPLPKPALPEPPAGPTSIPIRID